jgi:hypothetical protein
VCSLERCGKVFLMHIYALPLTLNIYRETHRQTSHKPLQHHFHWSPAARHGPSACTARHAQREDRARDDQPMLLSATAPHTDVERMRMMQCKPHARTQRTPVVVVLPCAPAAHCWEAAIVVEPSARPQAHESKASRSGQSPISRGIDGVLTPKWSPPLSLATLSDVGACFAASRRLLHGPGDRAGEVLVPNVFNSV